MEIENSILRHLLKLKVTLDEWRGKNGFLKWTDFRADSFIDKLICKVSYIKNPAVRFAVNVEVKLRPWWPQVSNITGNLGMQGIPLLHASSQ